MQVVMQLNRLLRQAVESSFLELLKTRPDQSVVADPALRWGVGLDDFQKLLPNAAVLWVFWEGRIWHKHLAS